MIKITGGELKNRKLEIISNFVRPTSSLKREAFFSIIESYALKNSLNLIKNKIFLDLFAGIGTMGLEAISRGFKKALFFENNKEVIKILKKNCDNLCRNYQYKIIDQDILNSNLDLNFNDISVIYIDPPYLKYKIEKILLSIQDKVSKESIIAIETRMNDNFIIPKKMKSIISKKYGKTKISFLVLS